MLDPDSDTWVDQAFEPATPQGALDEARSLLARGEPKKARKLLETWTEENVGNERYYEGMYLLGEAFFEEGDFYKAYESYDVVIQNTGGELFNKAIRREMDVARAFLAGQKRILWKIFRIPAYDDGVKIIDRVWEQVPGTRQGEQALKIRADYHFGNGDLQEAQDGYVLLVKEYPNGRYVRPSMLRAAEAAEAAFPGVKHDDKALVEADERYRQVQNAFPDYAKRESVDDRLENIRQKRAEKDLEIAKWYQKTKQNSAAEFYYKRVLKDYPNTLAATEAQGRLRGLGIELPEAATQESREP